MNDLEDQTICTKQFDLEWVASPFILGVPMKHYTSWIQVLSIHGSTLLRFILSLLPTTFLFNKCTEETPIKPGQTDVYRIHLEAVPFHSGEYPVLYGS
jgi:hypothetical protein